MHKLLLQADGVGGDDYALVVGERVEGGGQQVGEGFAHACACLDDDAIAAIDGVGDGARHLDLLGAFLKAGQRVGERAVVG